MIWRSTGATTQCADEMTSIRAEGIAASTTSDYNQLLWQPPKNHITALQYGISKTWRRDIRPPGAHDLQLKLYRSDWFQDDERFLSMGRGHAGCVVTSHRPQIGILSRRGRYILHGLVQYLSRCDLTNPGSSSTSRFSPTELVVGAGGGGFPNFVREWPPLQLIADDVWIDYGNPKVPRKKSTSAACHAHRPSSANEAPTSR